MTDKPSPARPSPSTRASRSGTRETAKHRAKRKGPAGTRRGGPHRESKSPAADAHYIYGLHAAEFALRHRDRIVVRIWATENAERRIGSALDERGLAIERVLPKDLDKRLGSDTVHQGVLLEVAPLEAPSIDDVVETALREGKPLVFLDQVTDPHNVGAVLRSCAVFGAAALVMPYRHSPPLGATLAKAASGALDLMPVCLIQNLAKALGQLKAQGFAVIGLDGQGKRLLDEAIEDCGARPLALVLGAEGKGLRALTRETCSELCRIASAGPIASLNVSNAAAVALHLAAMQRRRRGCET